MTAESGYMSDRPNQKRPQGATAHLDSSDDLTLLVSTSEQKVVAADGVLFEKTTLTRETFIDQEVETLPLEPAENDTVTPTKAVKRATETDSIRAEWSVKAEKDRTVRVVVETVNESTDFVVASGIDITDLNEQIETLEREKERLDKFASIVSHDIRNPLNVAMLNLTLLADEYDSSEIETARTSLDRIDDLINDLLVVAREGQSVDKTSSIDLATLAQTAWQHVETNGASLEVESSCQLTCDRTRLSQVFENLFRNSVEHGPETETPASRTNGVEPESTKSHPITVRVGALEDGFYIEDTGQGLPEEKRDQIFDLGYSESHTGTGFGLSIVERIISAHGWDITATESDCGGARFEIETNTN